MASISRSKNKRGTVVVAPPKPRADGMEVCPVCHRPTSPSFMWPGDPEEPETRMCLACHHHKPKDGERKYHDSQLKAENVARGYVMKAMGLFFLVIVLLVASLYLFYRPQTMAAAKKLADAAEQFTGVKKGVVGGGSAPKLGEDKADSGPADEKKDEAKKKAGDERGPNTTLSSADARRDDKTHMAPTVDALVADLPTTAKKADDKSTDAAASSIKTLLEQAQSMAPGGAADMATGAAAKANIHPNEKLKTEFVKTKDAALTMAAAVIDKKDPTGMKSADTLARLGAVSTTFADVATKLTDGVAPAGNPNQYGGNSVGTASSGGKLEGDVLEAQGRAGYDPMEAVRRELENDPAAKSHMIRVEGDPKARALAAAQNAAGGSMGEAVTKPGMRPGSRLGGQANGEVGEGIVQNTAALSVASLPAAFAAAARAQNVGLVSGGGAATGQAAPAAQMSVTVLSMRGDLLFDFNSAALRADANANLTQLAKILATQPNLPLLVRGYTDSKGALLANNSLSRKRAEIVRDWLVNKAGIKKENIIVQGLGPTEPVAPNENSDGSDNPGGREKNRRVTVTVPQRQQAAL
jgi:outer membrane protein OmpA-like peptidoglycan-associated protein